MYAFIGKLVVKYGLRFAGRKAGAVARSRVFLILSGGAVLLLAGGIAALLSRRQLPEG